MKLEITDRFDNEIEALFRFRNDDGNTERLVYVSALYGSNKFDDEKYFKLVELMKELNVDYMEVI